jgi:MtN3 and saliva related transmembrane protein
MNLPSLHDALGYLAALLTTSSFVPQAWLTLRTRDVSGISLSMYSAFTLGVALWLLYGIAIGDWPIIAANGVTLALASTILMTKVRAERTRAAGATTAATATLPAEPGDREAQEPSQR